MTWRKGNRLKLVPESLAQGQTAKIYQQIKEALGIRHIDGIYQALGAYPEFLALHWERFRPIVQTQEFFHLADRMRADCYTRMHGYFEIPDLGANLGVSSGTRKELAEVVDLHNYSNPLLLLMIAAQFQAFDSPVGQIENRTHPAEHSEFGPIVALVPEENAPSVVHRCYEDTKRSLGLPFVPSFYLSVARWTDFLQLFCDSLRPIVRSPVYEGCHYGSRETAFALVRELPGKVELNIGELAEAGISDEDIGSIVRILELFVSALSATVLHVAAAKIGLEGGTRISAPVEKSGLSAERADAASATNKKQNDKERAA